MNAKAALLRLLAKATDQQTCDDLAIVVHAFEQAKTALGDMIRIVHATYDDDAEGAVIANAEGVLAQMES